VFPFIRAIHIGSMILFLSDDEIKLFRNELETCCQAAELLGQPTVEVPTIIESVAQGCEYLLVEAAMDEARDRRWMVCGRLGKEYQAALTVDEWTDSPVVEITDPDSGEVVKRIGIGITTWLRQ